MFAWGSNFTLHVRPNKDDGPNDNSVRYPPSDWCGSLVRITALEPWLALAEVDSTLIMLVHSDDWGKEQ